MNKRIVIRIILFVAIIFWMMVIFGFSAAEAEESQSMSDNITEIIVEGVYDNYESMTSEVQTEIWNKVSFVVRKTGHFGEYAILGMLVSLFLMTFDNVRKNKKRFVVAVAFCAIYAITDEVHQGFVDGRSPMVMDVCIDSAGSLCGTVFVLIVWKIVLSLTGYLKKNK